MVLIKLFFIARALEKEKGKFSQSQLCPGLIATKNMSEHKSYDRDSSTKITQPHGENFPATFPYFDGYLSYQFV